VRKAKLFFNIFHAYIDKLRLKHAQHLLVDPKQQDASILMIAMDSGFNSVRTFNRVFKESFGT
jgi:transcriptional regulator GlxA family with amidase domain